MKILHIAPTPFFADRGCHMRILGEIKALQKRKHKIELCTYHIGKNIEGIPIYRNINFPWYKKLEAGPSFHKFYIDFFLLITSIKRTIIFKPDIIHGHLHEGALIGSIIKTIFFWKKIPLVFDVQGSMTFELDSYNYFKGFKKFLRPIFLYAEKFINIFPDFFCCSSVSNKDLMIEKFNVPSEKCEAIIDGVHTGFFDNIDNNKIKEIKIKYNIPNNKPVVIFTGALLTSKGINILLDAIPYVLKKTKNVLFLIVGYPEKEWIKYAKKIKIYEYTRFTGKVDYYDLPNYLAISNIAVDPKVDAAGEASGKIINYMGAGLPVVCFDSKNNRKFLENGGFFAKAETPESLAEKILEALNNSSLSKEKGKKNKERVLNVFSWDAGVKKIENIYKNLLTKN